MTKQATARRAADDARNTADEAAERTVVGLKEASAKAVSMTANTEKSLGDTFEKFSQRLQGLSSFNQQNLAALAKSSEIASKALGSIGSEVAAYTRKSYEDRLAAAQDISTAKTVAELFEKQTSFAQHAYEGWAKQAAKLSEIYTSAAQDIAAPLGERVSTATEELKSIGR